ncbi:hypothetical protein HYU96_04105 [Candidatus Daviesbacteria bacterium]|nr:hypothetical protein [Candidatus Daviesbacteria bacterium]
MARTHQGSVGEIRERLGNLMPTLQARLDAALKDKRWHTAGFAILEEEGGRRNLAISLQKELTDQEKEQMQAREEFGRNLRNSQGWARHLQIERPTLTQILVGIAANENRTIPEEELAGIDRHQKERYAQWIYAGRVYPDDHLVKGLFELLADSDDIKNLIGQKLGEAGDEPWASAWRGYLQPAEASPWSTGRDSPDWEDLADDLGRGYYSWEEILSRTNFTREQVLSYKQALESGDPSVPVDSRWIFLDSQLSSEGGDELIRVLDQRYPGRLVSQLSEEEKRQVVEEILPDLVRRYPGEALAASPPEPESDTAEPASAPSVQAPAAPASQGPALQEQPAAGAGTEQDGGVERLKQDFFDQLGEE